MSDISDNLLKGYFYEGGINKAFKLYHPGEHKLGQCEEHSCIYKP